MIVNHAKEVIRKKLAPLPENWDIFKWERVGKDATIYYCATYRLAQKGKRAGKKVFDKHTQKCVVIDSEVDAERARFESETGLCATCGGDGQEWAGWSITEGIKFQKCTCCNGTGKPLK